MLSRYNALPSDLLDYACDNLRGDFREIKTMNSSGGLHLLVLAVVCANVSTTAAFCGETSNGTSHNNSRRRIALVTPAMAHPTAVSASMPLTLNDDNRTAARPSRASGYQTRHRQVAATPTELSPEVKKAMETGAIAAQGISKVAVKRVGDVGGWVATAWRELNDVPRFGPGAPVIAPVPPVRHMRPIAEPKSPSELWFTEEHRFKTVVGR